MLFRFSDSKEVVFENFKFGFGLSMYSVSRVFLDFGLKLFKSRGMQEVKRNGLKTPAQATSYFGLLSIMSITQEDQKQIKSIMPLDKIAVLLLD